MRNFLSQRICSRSQLFEIITIVILFSLSIVIRQPYINRPLSDGAETMTAQVLITLEAWKENGLKTYHFSPSTNFQGIANKYIRNLGTSVIMDSAGNYFYVTFPPFVFLAPYFVFNLLGAQISALNLQIYNLFLQFLSVLAIYFIIRLIFPKKGRYHAAAVLGAGVYIFTPGILWYHSNAYFGDAAVQPFWIFSVLLLIYIVKYFDGFSKTAKGVFLSLFGVMVFLAAYTEWIGILFVFCVFICGLIRWKTMPVFRLLMFIGAGAAILAIGLMLWQYSSIAGFDQFRQAVIGKYLQRSVGVAATEPRSIFHFSTIWNLSDNFSRFFGSILFLIYSLAVSVGISFSGKIRNFFSREEKILLFLLLAPPLLHYAILLQNASIHGFAPLKFAFFISFLIAILYERLSTKINILSDDNTGRYKRYIFGFFAIVIFVLATWKYMSAFAGDVAIPERYLVNGSIIRKFAQNEEVVFMLYDGFPQYEPESQLVYYAGRNIQVVSSIDEAEKWLKDRHLPRGIVFKAKTLDGITNHFGFQTFKKIQAD